MHVSEKVSYHLSDAFFEKLMAADVVAAVIAVAVTTTEAIMLDPAVERVAETVTVSAIKQQHLMQVKRLMEIMKTP